MTPNEIVEAYLRGRNYRLFPIDDPTQRHVLDGYAERPQRNTLKPRIIAWKLFRKPARRAYPDTGMNLATFEAYRDIGAQRDMPILFAWSDDDRGEVYGEYLDALTEPRSLVWKGQLITYPWIQEGIDPKWHDRLDIIYFPLVAMRTFGTTQKGQPIVEPPLAVQSELPF